MWKGSSPKHDPNSKPSWDTLTTRVVTLSQLCLPSAPLSISAPELIDNIQSPGPLCPRELYWFLQPETLTPVLQRGRLASGTQEEKTSKQLGIVPAATIEAGVGVTFQTGDIGKALVAQWLRNSFTNAEDTGDVSSIPKSGRSPGGGNGNPLQYSCLENPMDRGAWWAQSMGTQRVGHDWAHMGM